MPFLNLKKTIRLRVAKYLIALCALSLGLAAVFYSPTSSSQSLPDCSTITGTAQPGSNCLFYGMSLCQTVPSASYSISSSYILATGTTASHRVNCADLSDLPLCSQIDSTTYPGKNCVKECSDSSFTDPDPTHVPSYVRGTDYAVHNRDCIRFTDSPENGIVATSSNSTRRKCHQLTTGTTPNPGTNCTSLPCNLLTPDELNDAKFSADTSKKYCNGDTDSSGATLKCYKFTQAQLPYSILDTMCVIHDCPPSSSTCGSDDTLNITNQGTAYTSSYKTYINGNYELNTGLCNPVSCKPVVKRQYYCNPSTTRNASCDSTGAGATCSNSYCYKTIDCNLSANSSEAECITSSPAADGTIGSNIDSMDSWFYRPKPMDKATSNGSTLLNMSSSLCYSKSQMESYGWGWHPHFTVLGVSIDLGYYHSQFLPDKTRSPGMCGITTNQDRGTGYLYLCGNKGSLYSSLSDYTAYHKGYVQTTFSTNDATHKVVVCLRFKNLWRPDDGTSETCGKRECGITCSFGVCKSQVCGYDVCRELTVSERNPKDCIMSSDMFNNENSGKSCLSVIDTNLRLRAVKYSGNRICTFLDVKGQLAYDLPFAVSGSAKLADGTCVSGTTDANGNCSEGKDSKDDKTLADKWRTIAFGSSPNIPYIQNNRPSDEGVRGYIDQRGQLFKEQECMKAALRIPPPQLFNLATVSNSVRLFTPPLYILRSMTKRSGIISTPGVNEEFGTTDFHYPEIEVQFGATTKKLSLGIGYTGYETSNADAQGSATITTTVSSINYSIEAFVRKEFDLNSLQPTFCLYRKLKDLNGAYLDPLRIQCVNRTLPEINNASSRLIYPSIDPKKLVIYADSANTYSSSKINFRYLGGFGTNGIDNSCASDDACSTEAKLDNANILVPTCSSTVENYQVCVQREECTQLNNECMKNEIDMQAAIVAGNSIDSFLAVRKNCNEFLLPLCNKKKGLTASSSATITNTNPSGATADPNSYGWFNEICISSGFESKLKKIVAYQMADGTRGKCLISTTSPYLTDSSSSTNCDSGGKSPNCLCIEAVDGATLPAGQIVRLQTAHEAGLCVDMPLPQTCAAIDYNTTSNTITPSDVEFVTSSLNQTAYGAGYTSSTTDVVGKVHKTHEARSNATSHAEFPLTIFGSYGIEGECKGFWRAATNSIGVTTPPKTNCLNVNGVAQWDASVTNHCVRYSCSQISTTGPNSSGNYQGDYGTFETVETTYQTNFTGTKGYSNGFATWSGYTKTTDFLETPSGAFASCITGFKKIGAASTTTGSLVATTATAGPFFGPIQDYTGGTSPTRSCNQLGQWGTVANACTRIQCPAISPPASPSTNSDWTQWSASGGATYPLVNASRSTTSIQSESTATGTCNNTLGFFKVGQSTSDPNSGISPTRNCDHMGNWGPVINPCTTRCDAITTPTSSSGWAYWNQVLNVPLDGQIDGVITSTSGNSGCAAGYYPYPYPALNDKDGTAFTISSSGPYRTDSGANSALLTIPDNLANDTRAAGYPKRVCRSITVAEGTANVWDTTSSSCVNSCPGWVRDPSSNDPWIGVGDPRIGAGQTEHPTRNGTITVSWPTTNFGSWAYVTSHILNEQNASFYFSGRTNGRYVLARYCNPSTHKWDAAAPQCAANNDTITDASTGATNANYDSITHTVAIGASPTTSSCLPGYYKGNKNTSAISNYTCAYKDSSQKIDEVYFAAVSPQTGLPCQIYCTLVNGQTFGSTASSYTGSTDYISPNGTTSLTCKSGYGKAIDNGTSDSYDNSCGRNAYDRRSTAPTVTCSDNGSWSVTIVNDCVACRGCNYDDNFDSVTGTSAIDADLCGDDGDFNFGSSSPFGTESCSTGTVPRCSNSQNSGAYPLNNQDLVNCYGITSNITTCEESQFTSISSGTRVNNSSSSNTLAHNSSMACIGRYHNESNKCSTNDARGMIKYSCVDGQASVQSLCKWSY